MQCRYAKSARGALARFVAIRGLDSPEGLREFTGSGNEWSFDATASNSEVFVFKRSVSQKKESKQIAARGGRAAFAERSSALKNARLPRNSPAIAQPLTKAAAVQKSNARPAITRSISKLNSSSPPSAANSTRLLQKKKC